MKVARKVATTTDTRRRRVGMASKMPRGKGMDSQPLFGDGMGFQEFFSGPGSWSGREI